MRQGWGRASAPGVAGPGLHGVSRRGGGPTIPSRAGVCAWRLLCGGCAACGVRLSPIGVTHAMI
eukprot:23059-Lingulodinium_polyedra.AAC.1